MLVIDLEPGARSTALALVIDPAASQPVTLDDRAAGRVGDALTLV
jgi:hypothetical protein